MEFRDDRVEEVGAMTAVIEHDLVQLASGGGEQTGKLPKDRAVPMADKGSEELVAEIGADALAGAVKAVAKAARDDDSKSISARRFAIVTDHARDALLTEFGKDTLDDRYLLPGEKYPTPNS